MNLQSTARALIILAFATSFAAANGADNLTGRLIKAYKAGKYESAEELGEKLVARHPTNYNARYYLANTYVILHKNEQAIGQYRICLNGSDPGPLKDYSSIALERLLKQKEQTLVAASHGNQLKDKEIRDFQQKIRKETKLEEQQLRREWSQAMERLDGGYGGRRSYGGGFGRRFSNDNERFRINDLYSKRLAELAHHEEDMLSQANCGTGKIRLAPSLSSSKVKNYINYGDESDGAEIPVDNPLHATARALGDGLPRATKTQTKRKPSHSSAGAKSKTSTKSTISTDSKTSTESKTAAPAKVVQ